MAKHAAVEMAGHLCMRRWCKTFVGADAHIGPYKPVSNIGTESYRESNKSAPEEGVQAAERPKNRARQRAI